jgi:hypothetical protein
MTVHGRFGLAYKACCGSIASMAALGAHPVAWVRIAAEDNTAVEGGRA